MTADNYLVLAILSAAVVLFVSEKLRADVVALLVLFALILTGVLTVDEAFSGFASPAVVTVWAVFIISGAVQRSGIADLIARQLLRLAGQSETRLLLLLMVGAGVMSAFMNNIGAVAILMPTVLSIGRKLTISPSRLLMPLAFAALLGGNMTLIGTPPNILATDIMRSYGVAPFAFFDFLPTGIMVLGAGVLYMLLIGRKLIPDRIAPGDLSQEYHLRQYLTEVRVGSQSSLLGRPVKETDLGLAYDLNVVHVRPRQADMVSALSDHRLMAGDVLLLEGPPQAILNASEAYRLSPVTDFSADSWQAQGDSDDFHLTEITLAPGAQLEEQTIREMNFRERYGLSVLAVRHNGVDRVTHLGRLPISLGDSLLVYGPVERAASLLNDNNWLVLESPNLELRRTRKIPLASVILLGVLVVATLGLLPIAALMLAGALLMVIGRVVNMDEAYQAIDWKAVFLIAGMLPLGLAMEKTGTAQLIAAQLVGLTSDLGPVVVLCTVFIMTALLTELISNAAAAVLVVPIAIDVAFGLDLNAQPFVMATVIAASTSFLMPIGHQVNIIIFGAGGYRFFDYARVGVGLNLLLLLITALFVPLVWPF
ncbi:MAG: SLC13 family permease [Candidatus Promineifilaceae bacterium]|nr:SLC13 family permease [Candidatus Promineifilaceae bacterium]